MGGGEFLGCRVPRFVGLTEVLFAVLIAWLLLGELPAAVQLLGGVLIVAGVALVRVDELRSARLLRGGDDIVLLLRGRRPGWGSRSSRCRTTPTQIA